MDNTELKRTYLGEPSGREHCCKWIGCKRQVSARMWSCTDHWDLLPEGIRNDLMRTYRPGQEKTNCIAKGYHEAARAAEKWIKDNGN